MALPGGFGYRRGRRGATACERLYSASCGNVTLVLPAKCEIFRSPVHVMHFHHAKPLGQRHAAGQIARKLAERLPVAASHDDRVRPLLSNRVRPRFEAEASAFAE